MADLGENLL